MYFSFVYAKTLFDCSFATRSSLLFSVCPPTLQFSWEEIQVAQFCVSCKKNSTTVIV